MRPLSQARPPVGQPGTGRAKWSPCRGYDQSRSLWRHRNFLLLWSGQTVSEMGSAVTQLALPLTAVVVLRASTFQVGALTAAATLAFALIALQFDEIQARLSAGAAGFLELLREGLQELGVLRKAVDDSHFLARSRVLQIQCNRDLCRNGFLWSRQRR